MVRLLIASILLAMSAPLPAAAEWKVLEDKVYPQLAPGVMLNTLRFSKDLEHFFVVARQGDSFYVQFDKELHGPYVRVHRQFLQFLPDETGVAFIAQKAGGYLSFVGGNETAFVADPLLTLAPNPQFRAALKNFAFCYQTTDGILVFDGKNTFGPFEKVVNTQFDHPSGGTAILATLQGRSQFLVDGVLVIDNPNLTQVMVSGNSNRQVEVYAKDGVTRIVEKGVIIGEYTTVLNGPEFNASGDLLGVIGENFDDKSLGFRINAERFGPFDSVGGDFIFSGTGSSYAVLVSNKKQESTFLVNGEEQSYLARVSDATFDRSGKHFAFAASRSDGSHLIVVDTKTSELGNHKYIGRLVVSDNGVPAYTTIFKKEYYQWFDNRSWGPFQNDPKLVLGDNQSEFAILGNTAAKQVLVINGLPGPDLKEFNSVLGNTLTVKVGGTVSLVARKNGTLLRIVISPQ